MFRRSSDPLALSEASLLALRPALNAPVLNDDFLPVGPARAAIVVFAEEYGGIGLAIGVRSNESGQIVVFRNRAPLAAETKIVDALEPALATAERMGFLFDEDMLESAPGGQGRSQAMALWGRLMGELETPSSPKVIPSDTATGEPSIDFSEEPGSSGSSLAAGGDELLLDDIELVDVQVDVPEDLLDFEDELVGPARRLSKFRKPATAETDAVKDPVEETVDGSTLGRIPLVRVRREGSKRVPFLVRLLSSF
jgi:hypothetical protein